MVPPTRRPTPRAAFNLWAAGTLRSYSQILFSERLDVAVLLVVASFIDPVTGAVGLAGTSLAVGAAVVLGVDPAQLRTGTLSYNALLTSLALGALFSPSPAALAVAAVGATALVPLHVAIQTATQRALRLPAMSLPFVVVGWGLAAATQVGALVWRTPPAPVGLSLPDGVSHLLAALGSLFFVNDPLAGLLVAVGLLRHRRITALHAVVGWAAFAGTDRLLLTMQRPGLDPLAFNGILAALALGGVFCTPSLASLALAAAASVATALLTAAVIPLLAPLGLPVLTGPFNVVVLGVLLGLNARARHEGVRPPSAAAGP